MSSPILLGWGSAADGQLGPARSDFVPVPRQFPSLPDSFVPADFTAGLWSSVVVENEGHAVFETTPPSKSPPHLIPGTSRNADQSALPTISSVASGRDFTLLLAANGTLFSLGSGAYGQLGLGPQVVNLTYPQRIEALENVKIIAIAASEFHWLALDSLGRVFSCGKNSSGQLGLGHNEKVMTPTYVSALWPHPVVSISTGDMHSAVLTACGSILCFGSNKHGQLGQTAFHVKVCSLIPVIIPAPQQKSTFQKSALDSLMQLGNSSNPDTDMTDVAHDSPTHDDLSIREFMHTYTDVSCGSSHTVALRSDGALVCWGKGENGQLGTRATRSLYAPTLVVAAEPFVSISAGDVHSAALTAEGIAYVWGDGSHGQIGDGNISDKYLPVALPRPRIPHVSDGEDRMTEEDIAPFRFLKVVCGGFHTLAMATNDTVTPVYSASDVYDNRIPLCLVDNMLQPKAGLSRFGSAAVLLRTFVRPHVKPLAQGKLDYAKAEMAYTSFLRVFGLDGAIILGQAAARIRHEAQVAFGLIREEESRWPTGGDPNGTEMLEVPLVRPKSHFVKDDSMFRSSVANCYECGYLFFIAMLNPVYEERQRVPELSELAATLLRSEENAREAFLQMVSYCPPQLLIDRLIRPLQQVLTDELKGYRRITRNAIFATKVLALCFHGVSQASARVKSRTLVIPRKEFYSETVSELVDLAEDYVRWSESQNDPTHLELSGLPPLPTAGQEEGRFSFCTYNFLLSEAAKFRILEIESHHTMNKESMRSVLSFGSLPIPVGRRGLVSHMRLPPEQMAHLQYLVLGIRRENIVSDAFQQVADLAENHHRELHKPLKVIFDQEDGVDEGGVRKEFYQVLLDHILSPDYGMFEYDEETRFHFFRRDYLEPEQSWTLIGIMFGLAAFNSILLDVQFPSVVYRKLQVVFRNNLRMMRAKGKESAEVELYKADLDDLLEAFPSIGRSLQHLLEYDGDDVEDVFCLTFEVSYQGLFGKEHTKELVSNGANIAVTKANREEFVRLYTDFLLNTSIESAFNNFAVGFSFMLNGPFVHLFSAEELETLLVGEKELDFEALRKSAKYEGYHEDSDVIRHLWQILMEYDMTMKRLFLSFVTGTDRAPIGGLRKLILVIQRAEGDSNRLPTSHTCFNVLLLPEYGTRAKLRDRLSTAIRNSKGFGLR